MAAAGMKAKKQLQEITECPICLNTFSDARMLQCIHTFCFECLKRTGEAEQKKPGDKMPCPLCRKEFIIPPEGVSGLQRNFFMENLLEFQTTLQGNLPTARIGRKSNEEMNSMFSVHYCNQHNQKPLEYYCADCKVIVCVVCFVESHQSHCCKDASTIEVRFRQDIRKAAWKASNYADEILPMRKNSEMRRENFLRKLSDMEATIIKRNQYLKDVIDKHTRSLLDELTTIKSRNLKEMEIQLEEIERRCTILKSFEAYCTELRLKGSAVDICSSVDQLVVRADELERDHEAFIGRPHQSIELSFQATDVGIDLQNENGNVVGNIDARVETRTQFEFFAVVVTRADEVVKVNLLRENDISSVEQIPSKIAFHAVTAVYCNTIYVTGVGENSDEIWKYNYVSGWVKCASLFQRRHFHSAVFFDELLYICGGYDDSDKGILDSVEAYNPVTDECNIVGKLVHGVVSSGNCVPFKSSLYIFGGSSNKEVHHVQTYNTIENKCSVLSTPMPGSYCEMRAVLYDTSVILLGKDSCFIFNIEAETWQERKLFKTDIPCFGLIVESENVFVNVKGVGGKEVRCIPLLKILNNEPIKWNIHATFPESPNIYVSNFAKMRFLV